MPEREEGRKWVERREIIKTAKTVVIDVQSMVSVNKSCEELKERTIKNDKDANHMQMSSLPFFLSPPFFHFFYFDLILSKSEDSVDVCYMETHELIPNDSA